jgi:hypothetical protein
VPLLPSMPKGEIVGTFYRQLFIDGKYNNDGLFWVDAAEKSRQDQSMQRWIPLGIPDEHQM